MMQAMSGNTSEEEMYRSVFSKRLAEVQQEEIQMKRNRAFNRMA